MLNWINLFLFHQICFAECKCKFARIISHPLGWNIAGKMTMAIMYLFIANLFYTTQYFVPDLLSWDKSYSLPEAWGFLQISTSTLERSESSETFQNHFEDGRCWFWGRRGNYEENLSDVWNNSQSWAGLMNPITIIFRIFCSFK